MADNNPFLPTFGTSPPMLAGRDGVVARFHRAFERGPAHPDYTMLISGVRGSGKTVMLNEAEDTALNLGWRVISVSASARDLCRQITNAALEHLRETEAGKPSRRISSMNVMGLGVAWTQQSTTGTGITVDLRSSLTSLAELLARKDTGLLLTVDEMQATERDEATELAVAIQHIARREMLPLAFVGAALPEIDETLLADRGMTFFQRCARARLLPLNQDETQTALALPVERAKGRIDHDALRLNVEASGGHPFTIQLLGYHSWEMAGPDRHITLKHARAGALESEQALLDQIVKPIWSSLSAMDRMFLQAMSIDDTDSEIHRIAERLGRSPNYVQNYRRRLIDAGAIEPAGRGKLRFTHQSMRPWLRSQQ
ncbi:ATP-binding protein [Candidatus Poriferisocius sp.]|uniref:ATP-binding protein n=1 Tax=Candidatus Poriferisocius sp. TaxID=3101276 RepID=UPI003B01A11D